MPRIFDMPWWWRVFWWFRGWWRRHVVGHEDDTGWTWDGERWRPTTPAEQAFRHYLGEEADKAWNEMAEAEWYRKQDEDA